MLIALVNLHFFFFGVGEGEETPAVSTICAKLHIGGGLKTKASSYHTSAEPQRDRSARLQREWNLQGFHCRVLLAKVNHGLGDVVGPRGQDMDEVSPSMSSMSCFHRGLIQGASGHSCVLRFG